MRDRIVRLSSARVVALLLLTSAAVLVAGCGDDKKVDKGPRDVEFENSGKREEKKEEKKGGADPDWGREKALDGRFEKREEKKSGGRDLDERRVREDKDGKFDGGSGSKDKMLGPDLGANLSKKNRKNKGLLIPEKGEGKDDSPPSSKFERKGEEAFGRDEGPMAKDKAKDKDKPKTPQVWKRQEARKTFARVYVGDKDSLELVSIHVSVVVEGPRARTIVDHVFRNPHDRQLEGTFEYPLPPGASPSYYAMFLGATRDAPPARRFKPGSDQERPQLPELMAPSQLARQVDAADWGQLREGRIVPPEKAAEAYEEVVRGKVDPALLEYASGNTFRGRVFPIQAKGYNRILIAYEETMPVSGGKMLYRFALPETSLHEMRFTLQFDPREGKEPTFLPRGAKKQTTDELTVFTHSWSDTTPKGEVQFSMTPRDDSVQATSGKHGKEGPSYLYARLRPNLPKEEQKPFGKHAVFLLDTSLSESPDRFGVSMKLLRAILESDESIEHFNVLCFNAGAAWLSPKGWLANTKDGREKMLDALDGILLEGATDLSAALDKLVTPDWKVDKKTPIACFLLSDGHLTWGETDVAPLVARFRKRCENPVRFFCYRTGIGDENAELFDALTRDGGGVFQCLGDAEVAAAAKAHRRQCLTIDRVTFDGEAPLKEKLVAGRRSAVYPDGELIVTGHVATPGKGKIVVEGWFAGSAFSQTFAVEVGTAGELAARGWAEVAVASLLALNDPWMESLVTAYCQQFNVASRAASFLVLENDNDYKRLNLEDEKNKTLDGDLGKYVDGAWVALAKELSLKHGLGKLLRQIDSRTNVLAGDDSPVRKILALLSEEDCALPVATVNGKIVKQKDANKDYLAGLRGDRRLIDVYTKEAERRHSEEDVDGAVRALSGVMEEYAGRGDALRLVGYRLLDMQQSAQATWLFARVLQQRPFEPHSFRDLARSLEDAKRHALAALMYECVLAGKWHGRFVAELKTVTREDHARLLRSALRQGKLSKDQREYFTKRLDEVARKEDTADLRVSITWNTDNTDVDLHVFEPKGAHVYYEAKRSPDGGQLSDDQTQGYGPERYQIAKASKGEYVIKVHYFRANPNLLGGETHVNVTVTRNAGTDQEKVMRFTKVLRRQGEMEEVIRVRY